MTLQLGLIHCSAVLYKLWVLCTRTAAGSKPYPYGNLCRTAHQDLCFPELDLTRFCSLLCTAGAIAKLYCLLLRKLGKQRPASLSHHPQNEPSCGGQFELGSMRMPYGSVACA